MNRDCILLTDECLLFNVGVFGGSDAEGILVEDAESRSISNINLEFNR